MFPNRKDLGDLPEVHNVTTISDCGHFFAAAAEKPASMKEYDETGVFGIVCRHGSPLRYINLYQGERMMYAYGLLKEVMSKTERPAMHWGLMYDIGCRFEKWLHKVDPDMASKITVCKFQIGNFVTV